MICNRMAIIPQYPTRMISLTTMLMVGMRETERGRKPPFMTRIKLGNRGRDW
uniref:Uncharacterized protein MANES_15G170300 n=1 Tax=Rhizophora mucronata TaxID=61149 RepID=A0A2P2QMC4_RHIMU